MEPELILGIIAAYFFMLIVIARLTAGSGSNHTFFKGERNSKWYLVSFGMIGASLSGITFVSVTGQVEKGAFSYMQMVLGYLIGYFLVAYVLMPVYYRLNVTSIYEYLGQRLGRYSYKIGAFIFLVSRFFGSSIRLLLVARILHEFVLGPILSIESSFEITVIISVVLIWLYTQRGGIKTIVITDTLQTLFMLLAAVVAFCVVSQEMGYSPLGMINEVWAHDQSKIFYTDVNAANHWFKMLLAGALLAFCMTGLDQDMMQKNLSCPNLKDAQKNMLSFSIVLVFVNLFFLILGGVLMLYGRSKGIDIAMTDQGIFQPDSVFPSIALSSDIGITVGVFFILGLVAAAYSSADSALASLTTSICVDFLSVNKKTENEGLATRRKVHVLVSLVMIVLAIVLHHQLEKDALYDIFTIAGYTYGPLLGLFVFGLATKRVLVDDRLSILICIAAPILTYLFAQNTDVFFGEFSFGQELLGINGLITFALLIIFSKRSTLGLQASA